MPKYPAEVLYGTLRFSPAEGSILELAGSFSLPRFQDLDDARRDLRGTEWSRVLGTTLDGKYVTLFDCRETSTSHHYPGEATSTLTIGTVFVGVHLMTDSADTFKRVDVRFSNLDDWAHLSGLTFESSNDFATWHLRYQRPPSVIAELTPSTQLVLEASTTLQGVLGISSRAVVDQQHYLSIRAEHEVPLQELRRISKHIRDFLTLAVGHPVQELSMEALIESEIPESIRDRYKKPVFDRIQILSMQPFVQLERHVLAHDMLLPLPAIRNQFGEIVGRWFDPVVMTELESVCNVYFGTLYNPHLYIENRFLGVVQAIESYHRARIGGLVFNRGELQARIKLVLDRVPEYSRWLRWRMAHGNEPALQDRIKAMQEHWRDTFVVFPDDALIQQVVDTRNYLSHYGAALKERAARGTDMWLLSNRLALILEAYLLSEMGLERIRVGELIEKRRQSLVV